MRFFFPQTFSIIVFLVIFVAILTWVLPAGKFERQYNEKTDKMLVVPKTYQHVEQSPQGYFAVFSSFSKGLIEASEIIFYILLVGGAYGVIMKTGAIDAGIKNIITVLKGKNSILIIVLMTLFAIAGTTAGFWEEILPFVLIIVPLMVMAGYDPLVGLAILIVGSSTGVMASTVNPFATGIGSLIAQVSTMDGYFIRLTAFFVCVTVSICYVLWYANRVKKDPSKSLCKVNKETYLASLKKANNEDKSDDTFTIQRKLIVFSFFAMILFIMYSIIKFDWWVPQITTMYISLACFAAIITKMGEKTFWSSFVSGAQDMIGAALIIGLSRSIIVIANDGIILDTILYYSSNLLEGLSKGGFIILNQIIQMGIASIVPSSSGHAALTLSIMAPLADLFSVPRSAVVSSYQFASGLINMITPTAGALMASLTLAKVSWLNWVKFIVPLLVIQAVVTAMFLLWSVYF